MNEIIAYRVGENSAIIKPLSVNRDWMDETYKAHAYKCFPVSLTNQLGWGLSFPEDITFIWDGISDHSADHVKILEGNKYCSPARGNATISFETGILLKTKEDTTQETNKKHIQTVQSMSELTKVEDYLKPFQVQNANICPPTTFHQEDEYCLKCEWLANCLLRKSKNEALKHEI